MPPPEKRELLRSRHQLSEGSDRGPTRYHTRMASDVLLGSDRMSNVGVVSPLRRSVQVPSAGSALVPGRCREVPGGCREVPVPCSGRLREVLGGLGNLWCSFRMFPGKAGRFEAFLVWRFKSGSEALHANVCFSFAAFHGVLLHFFPDLIRASVKKSRQSRNLPRAKVFRSLCDEPAPREQDREEGSGFVWPNWLCLAVTGLGRTRGYVRPTWA